MSREYREAPGIVMPLLGAAAGAIYGSTKEGEKNALLFTLLGGGIGVFLGVLAGSMGPEQHHMVGRGGRSRRRRQQPQDQSQDSETEYDSI